MGCRVDRFHAGRCACIPQDVWSEADVTKTQRTLSVWFKTVRRSSFLFKACKRLQENKDNCKITNKNIHKKRNKQWKNKENTICHANDYTIRRGIAYKTGI